jgi:hypothetical protein
VVGSEGVGMVNGLASVAVGIASVMADGNVQGAVGAIDDGAIMASALRGEGDRRGRGRRGGLAGPVRRVGAASSATSATSASVVAAYCAATKSSWQAAGGVWHAADVEALSFATPKVHRPPALPRIRPEGLATSAAPRVVSPTSPHAKSLRPTPAASVAASSAAPLATPAVALTEEGTQMIDERKF